MFSDVMDNDNKNALWIFMDNKNTLFITMYLMAHIRFEVTAPVFFRVFPTPNLSFGESIEKAPLSIAAIPSDC
jgi:hypothetical protein